MDVRLATSYIITSKKSLNANMYLQCKTGLEFTVCLIPTKKCLHTGVGGNSSDMLWEPRECHQEKSLSDLQFVKLKNHVLHYYQIFAGANTLGL